VKTFTRSPSPDRVAASYDPIDEFRDGSVRFSFGVRADGVPVGCRGVAQHTQDLVLRQKTLIIHGKQERLANRKGCQSCVFGLLGHSRCSFLQATG